MLDAIVVRCLVMQWNVDFHFTIVTTLWMLGWCMIALAALIYLPPTAIAVIALAAVRAHDARPGAGRPRDRRGRAALAVTRRLSLPWTYVTWLAVVIAVYPACRWFAGLKQRRRDWWLGYL